MASDVNQVLDRFSEVLSTPYRASDEQVRQIADRGWVALPGLISPDLAAEIRQQLKAEATRPRTALTASFRRPDSPGADANLPPEPEVDAMSTMNHDGLAWRNDFFKRFGTSARIGGTAAQLLARTEVLFVQDMSFLKPGPGRATVFHQDYPHWPVDRKGMITIWIALVDMTEDMGPLQYLDRSHLEGPLGRTTGLRDIREMHPHLADFPVVGGGAFHAGDAQAHLDLTVHGTGENLTEQHRDVYAMRFARTDVVYTGLGHPHYDGLNIQVGQTFGECGKFYRVGEAGLVDDGIEVQQR